MKSPFSNKTVLITGAAGFLGRYIIRALPDDCQIIAIDNQLTEGEFVQRSNVANWQRDITNGHVFTWDGPLHYIFHAAGIASPVFYRKYPLQTIDVAVKGTRNLLDICFNRKELEGFLYFSSSEIYGDPNVVPTPETYKGNVSCIGPRACYDEFKRLGETLCSIYHEHYGVPVRTVRPFNVFGPGMGHRDRRVVPMFTYEAFNGRPLPVFRDGMQTRTFCYVDDAVDGFFKAITLGRPGEAYNIGNPNNEISMRDLALLFKEKLPGTIFRFKEYPGEYPADEPLRRCPDITKARTELGYEPLVSLEDGLLAFIRWANGQPSYHD